MNTHADKASKSKAQVIANGLSKLRQSEGKSPFQLADNRPEAVAQRRLQELADNSQQVSRLRDLQQLANASPHVSQLKSLQELANNSPQVKQAAQLRALSSAKAPSPIQQEIANGIAQLAQVPEEEELIQGKFETVQLQQSQSDSKPRQNNTGLPDKLKTGIESLSGMSLDHVKVHYNSAQPAQLNALAYAQGSDIHVAPGQEQHLPHEAWHIVQQAQGRVQPTMQMKDGVPVNDDAGLEREADVMGARALAPAAQLAGGAEEEELMQGKSAPVQRMGREQSGEIDRATQSASDGQRGRPAAQRPASSSAAAVVENRPEAVAQQASIRSVLSSPRVIAKAKRLDGLCGTAQLRPDPTRTCYLQRRNDQEIAQLKLPAFSVSTSDLEGVTGQTSASGGYGQDVIQREQILVMLAGKLPRTTLEVTYSESASQHVGSDAATLKQTTIQALANEGTKTEDQGGGVHRFKINDGKGYLVYKRTGNDVNVFHFHWNYTLDKPLN